MNAASEQIAAQARERGIRIRSAREHQRLTLRELASKADVGLQTLIRLERGSPGVSQANCDAVMSALRLADSLNNTSTPAASAKLALHALHVRSPAVEDALEAAAAAACRELDQLFAGVPAEKAGISSNFQGRLVEHLKAMLQGENGARPQAVALKRLVYSDDCVGGPLSIEVGPELAGWVLRMEGSDKALQDGHEWSLNSETLDPYVSREAALGGFRRELELYEHLPAPVAAVPVYWLPSDRRGWAPAPAERQEAPVSLEPPKFIQSQGAGAGDLWHLANRHEHRGEKTGRLMGVYYVTACSGRTLGGAWGQREVDALPENATLCARCAKLLAKRAAGAESGGAAL